MSYIEACIEKHYLKILIFMYLLGATYLYIEGRKRERLEDIQNEIKDWFLF